MRSRRGEIATATVIIIAVAAVLLTPFIMKGANPFDRSADPSNRRTASALSGRDLVEITNAVSASEQPVSVKVDRSVEAHQEVTDPKLTPGQKIGRFFSGLGTWALIGILIAVFVLGISPAAILGWSRHTWRSAFKNTVEGIRNLDDKEAYEKVTRSVAISQNKRDKRLVDRLKSELH